MTEIGDTRVIHGNYGYIVFDGNIIGRIQNTTMTIQGGSNEFYELGTAWTTQIEVINRNVQVEVSKGAVNFELMAYAVGAYTDLSDQDPSFTDDEGNFNLLAVGKNSSQVDVGINAVNQILGGNFEVDVVLVSKKIIDGSVTEIRAKALDCKIITSDVNAPNNDYWIGSMSLVGTKFQLQKTGITISEN